ncbi:MAG: hypothetical protein QOF91_1713, partial [Alphaproteobacteria bacterium]|nr:hypothetical protein [Alphaproteobacteria bacterium]
KTIARAHKVHPIAAVQNEFSLLYRDQADDTRKTTRELGISFVAYAPLGRGLLTSDIADPSTLSEASPKTIERAHKVHPIAAVQNEFSLLYREQADDTRKTTRDLGISFVAYAPLGRGLLTADIADPATLAEGDTRKRQPRYAGDNLAHNRALAQKVEAIAKRKGCTPAQLALAWVLAQGNDVIPIPGTKQKKRLLENIGALNVKLSDSELAEIADAVPAGAVKGTRYPEAQMASLYI